MSIKAEVNFLKADKFEVGMYPSNVSTYIDKPEQGYQPAGPKPLEMLLASLGGSIAVYAKRYLTSQMIDFTELRVNVEADRETVMPVHLKNIKVSVHTDADLGVKKDDFMTYLSSCPVHNTLLTTKDITITAGH